MSFCCGDIFVSVCLFARFQTNFLFRSALAIAIAIAMAVSVCCALFHVAPSKHRSLLYSFCHFKRCIILSFSKRAINLRFLFCVLEFLPFVFVSQSYQPWAKPMHGADFEALRLFPSKLRWSCACLFYSLRYFMSFDIVSSRVILQLICTMPD